MIIYYKNNKKFVILTFKIYTSLKGDCMILPEEFNSCDCEACKKGLDVVKKENLKYMEELGWYAHIVPDDVSFPYNMNYHTHGLKISFNHPDFQVCLRVNPRIIHAIVAGLIERIMEGVSFKPGQIVPDAIIGKDGLDLPITFMDLTIDGEDYLRIIFPDEEGKLLKDEISEKYQDQWTK
jgi:hypothetical protein